MSKLIAVFLFIIITANLHAQNYWIRQPSPTAKNLTRCFFVDSSNGWVAGDSGIIVHTSNAGVNWVVQNSSIQDYLIDDIFFLNANTGWALSNDFVGYGTFILRTTNSGNNWSSTRYPDSINNFKAVYFLNSLTGFIAGTNGSISKTTNGGVNWTRCNLEFVLYLSSLPISYVTFLNSNTGFACGGQIDIAGTLWKTTDGGLNWMIKDTTNEPLMHVFLYNDTLAFASGGDLDFYGSIFCYSTNGGETWTDSTWGYFGVGQAIALRTLYDMWVPLGFSTRWMHSVDTGRTWIEYQTPDTNAIYDALFTGNHGWAVGLKGAIYKYNSELIGKKNESYEIPFSFNLFQNYPNPFNPSTTIKYSIPKSSLVKITLYDINGREVRVLMNGFKHAGDYEIKFSADGLSSGIYFYKLESGDVVQTRKLVILK